MTAKKMYFMDRLIDLAMTRLFQLAEYVYSQSSFMVVKSATPVTPAAPVPQQDFVPTICCSKKDNVAQPKIKMVEGELFK